MKCLRCFLLYIFLSSCCIAQPNLKFSLDSLFESYADSGFSGAVLVSEKNKITLKKGYGFANYETRKPNTPKTLFNVASIGKHFTVYSILLLEKQGLLSTSDHLSKYIGPFNDFRDSVTLHHLLTHTSGFFKEGSNLDYSTRKKFIRSAIDSGAEAKAGEKHRYSNAGYSMLAAIVEIVSGKDFEDFTYTNIFKPFKMKHTGYPWEQRMKKDLFATGYNTKRQPMPPQENVWAARGPGNMVTSVEDLYRWLHVFQNEKFVPADIRNKILYDHVPGKDNYSWNKSLTSRHTKFYHKGGGRSDFENRMMWYPDDEVIIIFLINNDYNLAAKIFNKIKALMN